MQRTAWRIIRDINGNERKVFVRVNPETGVIEEQVSGGWRALGVGESLFIPQRYDQPATDWVA